MAFCAFTLDLEDPAFRPEARLRDGFTQIALKGLRGDFIDIPALGADEENRCRIMMGRVVARRIGVADHDTMDELGVEQEFERAIYGDRRDALFVANAVREIIGRERLGACRELRQNPTTHRCEAQVPVMAKALGPRQERGGSPLQSCVASFNVHGSTWAGLARPLPSPKVIAFLAREN